VAACRKTRVGFDGYQTGYLGLQVDEPANIPGLRKNPSATHLGSEANASAYPAETV
jgi:hypothetical protein